MSYTKPKVTQDFEVVVSGRDRGPDGKLTKEARDFLAKVMPDTVHRIAPHVPPGRTIRIKMTIEGELV